MAPREVSTILFEWVDFVDEIPDGWQVGQGMVLEGLDAESQALEAESQALSSELEKCKIQLDEDLKELEETVKVAEMVANQANYYQHVMNVTGWKSEKNERALLINHKE